MGSHEDDHTDPHRPAGDLGDRLVRAEYGVVVAEGGEMWGMMATSGVRVGKGLANGLESAGRAV